jgi:hypothetical protein
MPIFINEVAENGLLQKNPAVTEENMALAGR